MTGRLRSAGGGLLLAVAWGLWLSWQYQTVQRATRFASGEALVRFLVLGLVLPLVLALVAQRAARWVTRARTMRRMFSPEAAMQWFARDASDEDFETVVVVKVMALQMGASEPGAMEWALSNAFRAAKGGGAVRAHAQEVVTGAHRMLARRPELQAAVDAQRVQLLASFPRPKRAGRQRHRPVPGAATPEEGEPSRSGAVAAAPMNGTPG